MFQWSQCRNWFKTWPATSFETCLRVLELVLTLMPKTDLQGSDEEEVQNQSLKTLVFKKDNVTPSAVWYGAPHFAIKRFVKLVSCVLRMREIHRYLGYLFYNNL
jgi:hypothetical protein